VPPLNGSGNAWKHTLETLHSTIKKGTSNTGGNMPEWGKVLNDHKILDTISYFQSKWDDATYTKWVNQN